MLSAETTLSKWFCSPSDNRSTLKGKTLLPSGAKSFLIEWNPLQKEQVLQKNKQEATKVVSLAKWRKKLQDGSSSLSSISTPVSQSYSRLFHWSL